MEPADASAVNTKRAHGPPHSVEERKDKEEKLVRKLIEGSLFSANDETVEEQAYFMAKAKATGAEPGLEDVAALALAGRRPVDEYVSKEPASFDTSKSKELLDAAEKISHRSTSQQRRQFKRTSDVERQKIDESFYFRYEKLHDEQEEVEQARKELGVDLREGNFLDIQLKLKDASKYDEQTADHVFLRLSNEETYNKVQEAMSNLFIRKPVTGEIEADSPAYLQLLKRKLHESRSQVDDLRKRVKELSAGLRVASTECRAGQSLVSERNDELNRQRNTINMLQLQLRNYKHRIATVPTAVGGKEPDPGSKEELTRELDEVRQELTDMLEINMVLEKEINVLKVKAEFRGGKTAEGEGAAAGGGKSALLQAVDEAHNQRREAQKSDMPTTARMKQFMKARQTWAKLVEARECSAMAALDFDALVPKTTAATANLLHVDRPLRGSRGRDSPVSSEDSLPPHPHSPMGPETGRRTSGLAIPGSVGPASLSASSMMPTTEAPPPMPKSVKRAVSSPPLSVTTAQAVAPMIPADAEGWRQSAPAWHALRKNVLSHVALSRADILRREEAHVKKYRNRVTVLVSELGIAAAERDMLSERMQRLESENASLTSQLETANEKIEELTLLAASKDRFSDPAAVEAPTGLSASYRMNVEIAPVPERTETEQRTEDMISEELARLRLMRERRQNNVTEEGTTSVSPDEEISAKNLELEAQLNSVTHLLNEKIFRLEEEAGEKDRRIDELMRVLSQKEHTEEDTSGMVASVMGGAYTESRRLKNLESEVLRKDRDVHQREREIKLIKVKLSVAEDQLSEEKAVRNLGLTRKAAARCVRVLRRYLQAARAKLHKPEEGEPEGEYSDAMDGAATTVFGGATTVRGGAPTATATTMLGGQSTFTRGSPTTGRTFRAPQTEDPGLKSKHVAIEEEEDEEESVLRQMLTLCHNPLQKDLVIKQISALELADSQISAGGNLAKREKEWYLIRRLWLRLLTIRETQWQEALTEHTRKKIEAKISDTYEALLRYEQNDVSESRPSMAMNGAMRVISMTAAPISSETGLKSLDEVEREYTALMELLKGRNAQLLDLQAERDEAIARIEQLSAGTKQARKIAVPPSAVSIRHVVAAGETAASISANYGVTNPQLMLESFEGAPRASMNELPYVWIPLRTDQGLELLLNPADPTTALPTFVIRHLVQDNETLGIIAGRFGVALSALHMVASDKPLVVEEGKGVACVDVWVPSAIAKKFLLQPVPDIPTQQVVDSVFARVPADSAWGAVSNRALARIFNLADTDLSLVNEALEEGSAVYVPLLLTKASVSRLPSLCDETKLFVSHTVGKDDTKESVADKYKIMSTRLDDAEFHVNSQVSVPLTSIPSLLAVVQDPGLSRDIDAICDAEEEELRRKETMAPAATGASPVGGKTLERRPSKMAVVDASQPLLALDRSIHVRATVLKRLQTKTLSRKGTAVSSESTATVPDFSASRLGTPSLADFNAMAESSLANLEQNISSATRLVTLAHAARTLREEITVPNFTLMNSISAQWLLRLRSQDSLATAREQGAEIHAVIALSDESVEDLGKALSISPTLIYQANEELEINDLKEKRFDYVRVPLINLKVQDVALRRTCSVYAVIPTYNQRIERLAADYGVDLTDISPFQIDLDPKITPTIFFSRKTRPADAAEFRAEFTIALPGLDFEALPNVDSRQAVISAVENDVLGVAEFAGVSGCTGNLLGVSVVQISGNEVQLQAISDSYEMSKAVERTVRDEGIYSLLDSTLRVLRQAGQIGESAQNLTMDVIGVLPVKTDGAHEETGAADHHATAAVPNTTGSSHRFKPFVHHHYELASSEAIVIGVSPTQSFADLALESGVGVESLLAYNPAVSLLLAQSFPSIDANHNSVLGMTLMEMPASCLERIYHVQPGDTLAGIAEQHNTTASALRRHNIARLPLASLVNSVRIPSILPRQKPAMVIKAQTEESFLALCTRFGVPCDAIHADSMTISPGSELAIPARAGYCSKVHRTLMPNFYKSKKFSERGETPGSIALDSGLLTAEIILANPSRVRVAAGASVYLPVSTTHCDKRTAQFLREDDEYGVKPPHSSSAADGESEGKEPEEEQGEAEHPHQHEGTRREGLFIRHVVTGNETLSKIASAFFQPITTILGANSFLFRVPGAQLVLIPLSSEERDEILKAKTQGVCTIIVPRSSETQASLAKRFQVAAPIVDELNSFMNDPKHIVMPLTSTVAISVARQQRLPLYAVVHLQQGETLVAVADRYGVFAKDLMVLGKPLLSLGVRVVDVPVAFDVAKRYQAAPLNPRDRLMLGAELNPGERLEAFLQSLVAGSHETKYHDPATSYTEVVLGTVTSLEKARERESSRLSQRSQLIDRTMQIGVALRQLSDRNDATSRELEKVDVIRTQNITLQKDRSLAINTESIAVQTEETSEDQKGRFTKNGMTQTKLSGEQYDYMETSLSNNFETIQRLEARNNQSVKEVDDLKSKLESLNKRCIDLGVQLTERTDRLNALMNRASDKTPGGAASGSGSPHGSPTLIPVMNPLMTPKLETKIAEPPKGEKERSELPALDETSPTPEPVTREKTEEPPEEHSAATDRPQSTPSTMEPKGASPASASLPLSAPVTPRARVSVAVGTSVAIPVMRVVSIQTDGVFESQEGKTRRPTITPSESLQRSQSLSVGPAGHASPKSPSSRKPSISPSKKSTKSIQAAPKPPPTKKPTLITTTSTAIGTSPALGFLEPPHAPQPVPSSPTAPVVSEEVFNELSERHELLAEERDMLSEKHDQLLNTLKRRSSNLRTTAEVLRDDLGELRRLVRGLFNGMYSEVASDLHPLTQWASAKAREEAIARAQQDEARRNEARVVQGVQLVSKALVSDVSDAIQEGRVRRIASQVLGPQLDAHLEKVEKAHEDSLHEEDWATKQLGKIVKEQVTVSSPKEVPPIPKGQQQQVGTQKTPPATHFKGVQVPPEGTTRTEEDEGGVKLPPIHAPKPPLVVSTQDMATSPGAEGIALKEEKSLSELLFTPPPVATTSTSVGPSPPPTPPDATRRRPTPPTVGEEAVDKKPAASTQDLDYLLMRCQPKSKKEEEQRTKAETKRQTSVKYHDLGDESGLPRGAAAAKLAPTAAPQIAATYEGLQQSIISLVDAETKRATVDPQKEAESAAQIKEEVEPVLGVLQSLQEGRKLSLEQQQEVASIRKQDRALKKQQMKATFQSFGSHLKMRRAMQGIRGGVSDMTTAQVEKVTGLWKNWLGRWSTKRHSYIQQRRENVRKLLDIFVETEQVQPSWMLGSPTSPLSPSAAGHRPMWIGTQQPRAATPQPKTMVRLHRRAQLGHLQPPPTTYRYDNRAQTSSSKHFSAAFFGNQH